MNKETIKCRACGKTIRKNQESFGLTRSGFTGTYHRKCVRMSKDDDGAVITIKLRKEEM